MAKTVIALYDDFAVAQQVVQELVNHKFDRDHISVVANDAAKEHAGHAGTDTDHVDAGEGAGLGAVAGGLTGLLVGLGALAIPGIGPVIAAGPLAATLAGAGIGAATGGLLGGLMDLGIPEEDAGYYAEGIRRGGTLVSVRADDNRAEEAMTIMNRYNPVDLERSATSWRESGWSRFDDKSKPYGATELNRQRDFHRYTSDMVDTDADTTRTTDRTTQRTVDTTTHREMNAEGEVRLPVVEEELQVGKRTVQRGGVRVHTRKEEIPVHESVELREEHVTVDRHAVDRPVTEADLATFQEGTIEVREMAEEAVISKQARVVEEVVIRKDVDTRTEQIDDTVTRTDVHVHEDDTMGAETTYQGFETYDTRFRTHYQSTYPNSRYSYEQYTPAYRYGYNLGTDTRYRGRRWDEIEPDARRYWEERNPNSWEEFKDSVRHAWSEVTN